MRLPAWLDVALEGGVLELERALAEYRRLRRLLVGEWRHRAGPVADVATHVLARHRHVEAALERAHRRARTDASAAPGETLAQRVEHERETLRASLLTVRGRPASFEQQLDWLAETASEESHYARSVLRFRKERAGMTVLLLGLAVAVPWSTWVVASMGGQVRTVLSLEGLEAPAIWVLLLVLLGVTSACWARLLDWEWVGVRPPPLLGPTSLAAAVGLSSAAAVTSFATGNPLPLLVVLAGSSALGALLVLGALWRDTHATGTDVLPLRGGEARGEGQKTFLDGSPLAQPLAHHASPLPLEPRHPRL